MTESVSINGPLLDWTAAEAARFGREPLSARHRASDLPWFSDADLIRLIDQQPRTKLRVFMSGVDPEHRVRDHQPVDTEGANGAEILESVKRGRLWVNLQRIDTVDPRFAALGETLYGELKRDCPHFHPVWINRAFLFVSSPHAMVYLHADYQPNMLFHMRGNKRIWIYPAYDDRIVTRDRIEEICSGGEDDIAFRPEFDSMGRCFDIGPGMAVSWPARAPHRVISGDNLNVSLSTFHETSEDLQRVMEHRADYELRNRSPLLFQLLGRRESTAAARRLGVRVFDRLARASGRPVKEYYARFRIDPEAPLGVREILGGPVLTEHSRKVREASMSG